MFIYSFISDRHHYYFICNRNRKMFFLINCNNLDAHGKLKNRRQMLYMYFKTTNRIRKYILVVKKFESTTQRMHYSGCKIAITIALLHRFHENLNVILAVVCTIIYLL